MNIKPFSTSLSIGLAVSSIYILSLGLSAQAQTGNASDVSGASVTSSAPVSGSIGTGATVTGGGIITVPVTEKATLSSLSRANTTFTTAAILASVNTIASNIISNPTANLSGELTIGTVSGQPITITVTVAAAEAIASIINTAPITSTATGGLATAIKAISNTRPSQTATIPPGQILQLINSGTPAGNLASAILAPINGPGASGFTGANNSVAANAAILAVAMQGLATGGTVNPAQLSIAVKAFNSLVTSAQSLPEAQRAAILNGEQLKATQAALGKLVNAAFAAASGR